LVYHSASTPKKGYRLSRKYTLETSTTLAAGSWTVASGHAGTGGFIDIFHLSSGHPAKNFFRVSAKLPLTA
jgi:hypothetical protein